MTKKVLTAHPRSGSAADTQAITDIVKYKLNFAGTGLVLFSFSSPSQLF